MLKTPEPRSLLKDKAYRKILERIQDSTFPPGSLLSERQLTSMLEMSKTPIKAALERLEQQGFVSVAPQQGVIVRELSIKEITDHFELRRALESYVVKTVTGKLSDVHRKAIEQNLSRQRTAASKNAVGEFIKLDADFHVLLCRVLGNDAVIDCLMQQHGRMRRVIAQVMSKSEGRLDDAAREHQDIFNAVKGNKPDTSVKLLERHLDFGRQCLLASRWES